MRFGVREICDVVFKPLAAVDIGNQHFDAMQPVLYLDTAKTSSLEGASTTVYAQGGKGNPRLIGWDGEKTLTFTVEDALMSPLSFHMLSGAGVVKGSDAADGKKIYVHQTYDLVVEGSTGAYYAVLDGDMRNGAQLIASIEAPIYATTLDSAGAQKLSLSAITKNEIFINDATTKAVIGDKGVIQKPGATDGADPVALGANDKIRFNLTYAAATEFDNAGTYTEGQIQAGDTVRIDCYAVYGAAAQELQIDAETFGGYYYIEASTLFRDEATGQDFPAEFVIPRGKIQSNFTFTMANSGDPSTFTFTIDAFPAYTKFDKTKKVMAALQIIDPQAAGHNYFDDTILGHAGRHVTATTTAPFNNDLVMDSDEYYNEIYGKSVFDTVAISGDDDEGDGN